MPDRVVTYVLCFKRNGVVLDGEIHRTIEDAGASAMNYVAAFCTSEAPDELERLLIAWDSSDHMLTWGDGEYSLELREYVAKYVPKEDNDCRVIPFSRAA